MLLACRHLRRASRLFVLTLLALLIVNLFSPTWVNAQENDSAKLTLSELQQQWKTINQSLDELQQKLQSEDGKTEELRSQYAELVDEANATIEQIRVAAMSDIESNDGQNMAAIRTLMGVLLNAAKEGDDEMVLTTGDFLIEQDIDPIWLETAAKSQRIPINAREIFDELLIRQRQAAADDLPQVKLTTSKGEIIIELFENEAPEAVGNFISLVEQDFYKKIFFHRVLEGFMAQTGCPEGTGGGGPGYEIECECDSPEARPHFTGSLSMAHAGKDTGGSQFFLTFKRTEQLDGVHTVFGRVVEGLDILDELQRTHVVINRREEQIPDIKKDFILSAEVIRKRDHVYRPNKVGEDNPPMEEPEASDKKQTSDEPVDGEAATEDEADDTKADDDTKSATESDSE